jgi:hypothetical protein
MHEPNEHDVSEDVAWQRRLHELAGQLTYPPTPDVTASVHAALGSHKRRTRSGRPARILAWAALIVILLLGIFAAVPELRAAVLEALRIGAVRIFPFSEPEPTGTPGPVPTATALASILDLPGETTLEAAQQQLNFRIRLPGYPPDLGAPDRVFLHGEPRSYLTLVWLQEGDAQAVDFSLSIIDWFGVAEKYYPWKEQPTVVNGRRAVWLTGVHELYQESDDRNAPASLFRRLVQHNVLIWEADRLTYRLESDYPLDEAQRIAESLR